MMILLKAIIYGNYQRLKIGVTATAASGRMHQTFQ